MGFRPCSDVRGFSLVELLTAMTVFTVGLLAVASMQLTAMRANASAHSLTVVSALAEGALEEILALDADNPLFSADRDGSHWASYDATGNQVDGTGVYQATCTIDADYGLPNLARVQVTLSSMEKFSRSHSLVAFKKHL